MIILISITAIIVIIAMFVGLVIYVQYKIIKSLEKRIMESDLRNSTPKYEKCIHKWETQPVYDSTGHFDYQKEYCSKCGAKRGPY